MRIIFRVSEEEKRALEERAAQARVRLSVFVRRALLGTVQP